MTVLIGELALNADEAIVFPRGGGLFVGAGEHHAFDLSSSIFDHSKVHLFLVFEKYFLSAGDDPSNGDSIVDHIVRKLVETVSGAIKIFLVFACRVIAYVEPEELFFPIEKIFFGGGSGFFEIDGGRCYGRTVKERGLFGIVLRGEYFDEVENGIDVGQHLVSFCDPVEGAHFSKRLKGSFVEIVGAHTLDEIGDGSKLSIAFPFSNNRFGHGMSDIFYSVQSKTDDLR